MLRYKKHKRQGDGSGASGVGVMDDTDREVSSFTDRAFRSLCVAEEEPLNDVPHLPSPIRGMPLSTKYHLGIFNLSVRKTQPLAQLPTIPRQRGRWAPTFQPLLKYAKDGLIDAKTNNRLCAPEPRGYKQRSKVSSLIKTFDNIENEIPDESPLHTRIPLSTSSQTAKLNIEERPLCETVEKIDINHESLASINPDDTDLNHNSHRRTAREVFLESKAEICSPLSGSPCSLGSPIPDQLKKVVKKKDSLRRTTFLHSENSAFKSWSDINKKVIGGDESDSSIPGTPPILRSATPCSPLLSRAVPGIRSRDVGQDVGWASPASTLSSSYDAIQMLRTVPPLPNKKTIKQSKDSSHRTTRVPLNTRIQEEDMHVDEEQSPSKDHPNWMNKLTKSKSPQKIKHEFSTSQEAEAICDSSQSSVKQNKEVEEKVVPSYAEVQSETIVKEDHVKVEDKQMPSSGRIKSLIQQMEKEAIKDVVPLNFSVKKQNLLELAKDDTPEAQPAVLHTASSNSNPPSSNKGLIPPWRRTKHHIKMEPEEKSIHTDRARKDKITAQYQENVSLNKDDFSEEKPIMSPFNISNLLTPIIRRKNIQEALEENQMMITPPVDTITTKDQDLIEVNVYQKRDDYKSKATSLMFNLKDMRKRVKSTYGSATKARNGYDSNLAADVRVQVEASHTIALPDTNKLMSDREELSHIPCAQNISPPRETEIKPYVLANTSDNYLSLSSPPQIMASKIFHNGEIPAEKVDTIVAMQEEDIDSLCLSPTDNLIRKGLEYPSLNLYHKEDTDVNVEQKEYTEVSPVCIQTEEEPHPQYEQNVIEAIKLDEPENNLAIPAKYVSESQMDSEPSHQEQSNSPKNAEKQLVGESDEGGKKVSKRDDTKDSLQYFAVSNCSTDGSGQSGFLDTEDERKEGKEKMASDKQTADSTCIEDLKRPSSTTSFKPNLFLIKDNKIKSSPVTKSVRLPLFRSLSVDCLAFRKGEETSLIMEKVDLRESNTKIGENKTIKSKTSSIENMEINNIRKHQEALTTRPASETPNHENIGLSQVKMQKEEEDIELWNKLCCANAEWRKNKSEDAETVKVNESCNDTNLHGLEGPFFHPVETCVSEVMGPSPECNTLLVHNVSESMNDLVNGQHMSSPLIDTEIANYSPLENELLQFEDAISFSEGIPCSTIASPMLESVACSMVASPMSVNTQSSGFATALSALDDMPSPPSIGANSSNGKFQFPEKLIAAQPSNMDLKNFNCTKYIQKKSPTIELQNMHAAKPPTVPPKTEKALRRAKRLTKKRRKTEIPQRLQDGDIQESDFVLDVPSPANVMPTIITPQSHLKVASSIPRGLQHEESISESSTPSLPNTQRKLLQDPDSGQYFVVDIPVYLRIKTFYDPETGKYLQMSLPPSERETPALEMSTSPYMLYPGLTPVPVSSIESFKEASQLLTDGSHDLGERTKSWDDTEEDSFKMQQFIDFNSRDHSMTGTPQSMDRIVSRSRSPDIISMKDIDDFAMEAIS
ncbi:cardiac-enriched FHL2-interacting protein [Pseudophryne corroboree]|uniref:cardiac-enriched FHL2-interacting protein n=1 Tax=Pseudophryne corroboree TaxID=495146 RepID=UPI003081B29C